MIRVSLILSAVLLAAQSSHADETASTKDVYACAAIETDADRLACYDNAVGRLKAAEEAGEVATVTRAEVEQVKRDSFGFSIPSLPKLALPRLGGGDDDGEIKEVSQAIASVRTDPYKKLVVTLDNGQVWQQTDSTKVYVSKKSPPTEATIKRAAVGSFKMTLNTGKTFRAKRVK